MPRVVRRPPADVADDVEHLAGTDTPVNIARRLGYANVDALRQTLRRAGRRDLLPALNTHTEAW